MANMQATAIAPFIDRKTAEKRQAARTHEMALVCDHMRHILQSFNDLGRWRVWYVREDMNSIAAMSAWDRERFAPLVGDESVYIGRDDPDWPCPTNCEILYRVNVTGDAALTAVFEVARLMANKF